MGSTITNLSSVLVEVNVGVSKQEVADAMNKAYSQLGRTARIRGFRKGKAPRAVLQRMFGDAVRGEVRGELVGDHLQKAIEEHKLEPLSQPEVDAAEILENEQFDFKVKFEVRPHLEAITYDGIELEKYKISVSPENLDAEIERLRSSVAEIVDLEAPRPAGKGDLVTISVKRWVDGKWEEAGTKDQKVTLGEKRIESEIETALTGANVGDEKVVDLGSDTEMEEDRPRYMVTVVAIQGRKLPELDDEFARDMGDYEDLAALRKGLEERMLKYAEESEEQRLKHKLFDSLREKNEMDLPQSLVERQAMALTMRIQSSLAMIPQGGPGDKEREEIISRAGSAAREMVHQHLLVLECAQKWELEVSEEEIDTHLEELARENGLPLPMVKAEYGKEGRREDLKGQLIEKKVFDFLCSKVKITEVDPPDESEDGKDAKKE